MLFPQEFSDPQSVQLGYKSDTQVSDSHGGTQYANQIGQPHQWTLELTTPPLNHSKSLALFSFAASLAGRLRACSLPNPLPPVGFGLGASCTVRTAANQFDSEIAITGAPSSKLGALMPGDFISLLGHEKAYMVTAQVNTNGLGQATIPVTPSLRKLIGAGVSVKSGADVRFNMALKTDVQKLNLSALKPNERVVLKFEERLHD